jgi:hypothetical protein
MDVAGKAVEPSGYAVRFEFGCGKLRVRLGADSRIPNTDCRPTAAI